MLNKTNTDHFQPKPHAKF